MSLRILVVDDDKQIARILQSYLTQEGMTVLVAYDGEEALHLIRRERPDCVVLDLMLPKRSGLDLTRLVRGLRLDREQHLFDAGRSRPRHDADRVCAAARLYGVSESCFYARGVG
jgi:CheY-like chemotaxis protein